MTRLPVLSSVCLLLAPIFLFADDKPKSKFREERDIVFSKVAGEELKLNLAIPTEGTGPFPGIILIHGGAWQGGTYKDMFGIAKQFADRGYVAVSSGYRLVPKHRFPTQVEDCKCAVRWMRANAKKYNLDPGRIGAVGLSAGGHLVCMLGLAGKEAGLEGNGDLVPEAAKESSAVQAVASWAGPTDFTKGDWDKPVDGLVVAFFGGNSDEKKAEYAKGSPVTYVRKETPTPPFIFFHGTKDNIVRHSQSVTLHEALKAVGGTSRLESVEGAGHGWIGKPLETSMNQMFQFMDEHLKKKQVSGLPPTRPVIVP